MEDSALDSVMVKHFRAFMFRYWSGLVVSNTDVDILKCNDKCEQAFECALLLVRLSHNFFNGFFCPQAGFSLPIFAAFWSMHRQHNKMLEHILKTE